MIVTHLKLNDFEIQALEASDYKRVDEKFRIYKYEGSRLDLIATIHEGVESFWIETEGMKLYDLPLEEIDTFNRLIKMFHECNQ